MEKLHLLITDFSAQGFHLKLFLNIQALLINHFMHTGGYYPIGGASEIAYNMIPIIEKSGGKVLVKADVTEIICNNQGEACGVLVKKGSEEYRFD